MPTMRRGVCTRRRRPARAPGCFGQSAAFFRDIVTGQIGGDAQKVRRRSRPAAAFRHESPDTNCYWVHLDEAFDRGFAVCIVGVRKGAGRPQRCSASRGPQGEVCHARQALETDEHQAMSASHTPLRQAGHQGCGVARSRSRQSSLSERRCCSPIGDNVSKIARSAKSDRPMISSMPFTSSGRAALNSTSSSSV